uniref:Cytochrome P450 714C2-like n=1 Tax=Cicer arietinum TaxID=3827 RepID=A0A1S2Z8L3_CICAR|nr:cytochrome P450 714C2-like [Cicer arietinum]
MWRLEKEINSKISKLIKQHQSDAQDEHDLLQMILDSANKYWQDRVRVEVIQVCGYGNIDATILKSMKTRSVCKSREFQIRDLHLTIVIQETLRFYPPSSLIVRIALQNINLKGILVPKGMDIQIPMPILHQDSKLWGHDAHKFNPQRFANGVNRACKVPQVYMPFGIGPHVCVGQHLAMLELKVILSLILLKFRFSLSSSYCHSPSFHVLIEPLMEFFFI